MESIIFSLDNRQDLVDSIPSEPKFRDIRISKGNTNIERFSDGEVCIDFKTSVRGKRIYLLTSPNTSEKILLLNFGIDAAKRAGANEIIPIIPYFPYARQDKKDQPRGPIC